MKIKTLILIGILFLLQNSVFAKATYIKQLSEEQNLEKQIERVLLQNKSMFYEMMLQDDFLKRGTIERISILLEHYQNDVNSYNYQYCVKAQNLYFDLIKYSVLKSTNCKKPNKIMIPDEIYNKLDTDLINAIVGINVIAENL